MAVSWAVVPVAICKLEGVIVMVCKTALVTVRSVEPETAPSAAVIVVLPEAKLVASPELSTLATAPAEEVQIELWVISCELPSLKVPVATNCCCAPAGIDGFAGVKAIEVTVAEVTVSVALPVITPDIAVIVTVPGVSVLTNPALSMVATVASDDCHVTPESACVLLSVNSPVAANCTVLPAARDGEAGAREMETRAAGSTVNAVLPVTEPDVALIVTVPAVRVVAIPVVSIETMLVSDEDHVTLASCWLLPSLKLPVAVKGCVTPSGTETSAGVKEIVLSVGAVTVKTSDALMLPIAAEIVTVPAANVEASPEVSMEAIELSDDDHVAWLVTSCVLPSLHTPVALNCSVAFTVVDGAAGVTMIELKMGVTVSVLEPCTPPKVAVMVVVPLASPVASPEVLTEATLDELEDHVTWLLTSLLDPSLYEPVAMN